jgi:hypothetical protein
MSAEIFEQVIKASAVREKLEEAWRALPVEMRNLDLVPITWPKWRDLGDWEDLGTEEVLDDLPEDDMPEYAKPKARDSEEERAVLSAYRVKLAKVRMEKAQKAKQDAQQAEKDRLAYEESRKAWRKKMEMEMEKDRLKAEKDNKKANQVHNEWMMERWREEHGWEDPRNKKKIIGLFSRDVRVYDGVVTEHIGRQWLERIGDLIVGLSLRYVRDAIWG